MGYANRLLIRDYPDLSEDGDLIRVVMVNPKTASLNRLQPKGVDTGPDGRPVDSDAATKAMYDMLAGLIHDWHVYDADADGDVLLPLPASGEAVSHLPMGILSDLLQLVEQVTAVPQ